MDEKTRMKMEARARIVKAMAHPSRLFIVDELAKGELCVCKLTEMVGADMSTVSKHLAILREAGIIQSEKQGTKVMYKLRVPCVLNFFSCVESVILANVNEQVEMLK
ncbi:MAG: winged helix-turn-helix transcriptional regulator [Sedimentisphaerales bacterium]|nr:winged helix-turn-helix transcriptional regulator [Sedimentisphaerales bacterium]